MLVMEVFQLHDEVRLAYSIKKAPGAGRDQTIEQAASFNTMLCAPYYSFAQKLVPQNKKAEPGNPDSALSPSCGLGPPTTDSFSSSLL